MDATTSTLLKQLVDELESLKNLNSPFYTNAGFIGSVIASITALIIAIFTEPFLNKFVRKTKLKVKGVTSHIQGKGDLFVHRLLIKNEGNYRAKDVEVNVEQIYDGDEKRKNFLPAPLGWTHSHAVNGGQVARDIHPNQSVYLDICNYINRKEGDVLRLSLKAGQEIEDFCTLKLGSTKLELKAYQDSGQTVEIILIIDWNGKNNPSIRLLKK
jgi:hypothetical protein